MALFSALMTGAGGGATGRTAEGCATGTETTDCVLDATADCVGLDKGATDALSPLMGDEDTPAPENGACEATEGDKEPAPTGANAEGAAAGVGAGAKGAGATGAATLRGAAAGLKFPA